MTALNVRRMLEAAAVQDRFVWFDLEDHETTDATLDTFESMAEVHPAGVGVCLQANLRRTAEDLDRLAGVPGVFRLVKGAYDEPAAIAYTDRQRINEVLRNRLEQAFSRHDGDIAVSSQDPAMMDHAIDLAESHDNPFQTQMLLGVREAAQTDLAADYEVRQYVPCGRKWVSYFCRRLLERKKNLLFAIRAVIEREAIARRDRFGR